jgi:predicted phosphoribosyltransferase
MFTVVKCLKVIRVCLSFPSLCAYLTGQLETITVPSNSSFRAVGQYYQNFQPVEDAQVIQIMRKLPSRDSYPRHCICENLIQ